MRAVIDVCVGFAGLVSYLSPCFFLSFSFFFFNITGGAGREVKFWDFELVADAASPTVKRLDMAHTRTLQLTDDVLAIKHR